MACQVHDLDGVARRTERRCLNWAASDSARPEAVGVTGHLPWSDGQSADPRRCHQRCDNALRRRRCGWLRERRGPDWRRRRIRGDRHFRKWREPGSIGSPGLGRPERRGRDVEFDHAGIRWRCALHRPNGQAAQSPGDRVRTDRAVAAVGRSHPGQPRDRGHLRRHAAAEVLPLPHQPRGFYRAARCWHRHREHGQQSCPRLRPGRARRHHGRCAPRAFSRARARRQRRGGLVTLRHWGTEGQTCPDANQLALAPKLAAAGANIIVGSHAHILQGSGWLGRTFVAYGMANFLWWETSYSTATGVLLLTLHRRGPLTWRFVPATVSGTGQPILDTGRAAKLARAHYRSLRTCAQLSAHPGH